MKLFFIKKKSPCLITGFGDPLVAQFYSKSDDYYLFFSAPCLERIKVGL
jgi:hypothetical protein